MGQFSTVGIESLQLSMDELARLPDGVLDNMLDAGARPVVEAQKEQLRTNLKVRTGVLSASPAPGRRRKRYIDIYPQGDHHTYPKDNARNQGKEKITLTNAKLAYIHEFGSEKKKIKPTQSIRIATEKSAPAVVAEQERVYNEWLNSLNL